jgi:hypothetical protein
MLPALEVFEAVEIADSGMEQDGWRPCICLGLSELYLGFDLKSKSRFTCHKSLFQLGSLHCLEFIHFDAASSLSTKFPPLLTLGEGLDALILRWLRDLAGPGSLDFFWSKKKRPVRSWKTGQRSNASGGTEFDSGATIDTLNRAGVISFLSS